MATIKKVLVFILSSPVLLLSILWAIATIPIVIIVVLPILIFINAIMFLRGEETMWVILLWAPLAVFMMWMDIVGIQEPDWMDFV